MKQVDLSWITAEIEETQAYHRARVAALHAGEAPNEALAIAGRNYGYSHGLWGTNDIDMLLPDLTKCEIFQQSLQLALYVAEATKGQIIVTCAVTTPVIFKFGEKCLLCVRYS